MKSKVVREAFPDRFHPYRYGLSLGAGNGRRHGLEAELGSPCVRELDGMVGSHADGAAAVEGAELAIGVQAEHVRDNSQVGVDHTTASRLPVRRSTGSPPSPCTPTPSPCSH